MTDFAQRAAEIVKEERCVCGCEPLAHTTRPGDDTPRCCNTGCEERAGVERYTSLRAAVAAALADVEREATAAAIEKACRAVCHFCYNGEPHDAGTYPCDPIRRAFEEGGA